MYFLLLSIVLSNEEVCSFDVAMQLEKEEAQMILGILDISFLDLGRGAQWRWVPGYSQKKSAGKPGFAEAIGHQCGSHRLSGSHRR